MKTTEPKFTQDEIADWHRYEQVRKNARWNMLDPRAMQATGLSPKRFAFAQDNYEGLAEAALGKNWESKR